MKRLVLAILALVCVCSAANATHFVRVRQCHSAFRVVTPYVPQVVVQPVVQSYVAPVVAPVVGDCYGLGLGYGGCGALGFNSYGLGFNAGYSRLGVNVGYSSFVRQRVVFNRGVNVRAPFVRVRLGR